MKKLLAFKRVAFLFILAISITSCLEDECDETRVFLEFEAVYAQPEDFRIDINTVDAREMQDIGKMYFYNEKIFINERYEGIHIIDNSDPANPINEGFIDIPGNLDIAVKDNYLYADNYVDLLTLDISNLNNPQLLYRDEEVFTVYTYHEEFGYYIYNKPTERKVQVDCSDPNFGSDNIFRNGNILFAEDALTNGVPGIGNSGNVGVGGSFARFTISQDHIYVLNTRELVAYNIDDPTKPINTQTTTVSWGNIETLFPYQHYLFIGANNGMYIYDASEPASPFYVSEFRHARACDPVFVKNDIAYVTLRDGTACESFTNQLEILDISNISDPTLIASFDMDNPHGLSVSEDYLYLCEGAHGMKVFETDNLTDLADHKVEHIKNLHAYDVIALSDSHLLLVGDDGLYQYNTSDPENLKEISFLSVTK